MLDQETDPKSQFLDPETVIMYQFLGQETNIMGEGDFMSQLVTQYFQFSEYDDHFKAIRFFCRERTEIVWLEGPPEVQKYFSFCHPGIIVQYFLLLSRNFK